MIESFQENMNLCDIINFGSEKEDGEGCSSLISGICRIKNNIFIFN